MKTQDLRNIAAAPLVGFAIAMLTVQLADAKDHSKRKHQRKHNMTWSELDGYGNNRQ